MPPTDPGRVRRLTGQDTPDTLAPPQDAAQWFSRMQSGDVTEADRQAFAAWCEADPANEPAYRRLNTLWDATLAIPESRLRALMREPELPPPVPARRRIGLGLTTACTLAVVAGAAGTSMWLHRSDDALDFSTPRGERRQARLPDGSTLHLNSETRIAVRFGNGKRRVELVQGEAFFEVRRDAERPFIVDGGLGQITVTGTRFNVRREPDELQVSVESGSVRLEAGPWWRLRERRLTAGQQAIAYADQSLGKVADINVDNLVAWQRGKVVFNNVPLATVIREMNRYLPQPAIMQAASVQEHRISGVFDVDRPQAMIDALPAIAPVAVYHLLDGQTRIVAR